MGEFLLKAWRQLNGMRPAVRRPIKCGIFLVVLGVTLYPHPVLLSRYVGRLSRVEDLVQGDAPELAAWQRELDPAWEAAKTPAEQLAAVQNFVYAKLQYEWDWNTWGVIDYWPTVAEIVDKGKEDCDGQAVLAASLLQGRGVKTRLAANVYHMWVVTDQGETMTPAKTKIVESTADGIRVNWAGLADMKMDLAFGLAVFPLVRELILLVTLWALWLSPRGNWRWGVGSGVVLLSSLMILRWAAGAQPYAQDGGLYWTGLVVAAIGAGLMIYAGKTRLDDAAMAEPVASPEPATE